MGIVRFERWCAAAVSRIRFKPDRKAVWEELYAHMEDQYEELLEAGYRERDAEKEVAEAMGDPGETAEQLERIHRPFWGYALRAARWCLLAAVLLALFTLPPYIRDLGIRPPGWEDARFGGDQEYEYGTDRLVYYAEPGVRARSDGYTFTVTRVAERQHRYTDEDDSQYDGDELYLQVEVRNTRPWTENNDILREFYAVDSLGNVYGAYNLTQTAHEKPTLSGNPSRTGLFTYTWTLWLWGYRSQGADWLELRYDRCGRDIRLTIDLSGRRAEA